MRIGTGYNLIKMTQVVQNARIAHSNALEPLATGRKINHLSDEPAKISEFMRLAAENSRFEQYSLNLNSARTRLQITESVLTQLTELTNQASTLMLQANDETLSLEERQAVITRLNDVKADMVEMANTKVGNNYIFAGYEHTTQPFDGTAGTFNGDTNDVNIKISPTKNIAVSLNGDDLFTGGSGNRDVFDAMDDAIAAATAIDDTAMGTAIADMQAILSQFNDARATVGGRMQSLDYVETVLENQKALIAERQTMLSEVDMAEATTELSYREYALTASFEVTRRLMSITLESFFN